ncbi:MAG: isoaspartyl peptidase/L-asparaginase family protein [Candidatus Dormibacteraceae bacterium]
MPQLIVHGGAGSRPAEEVGPRQEACERALERGWKAIDEGALAAALEAVREMEDDPLFDAGFGSVLTADGRVEMDAGIMLGDGLRTGAVAAVRDLRHPVDGALAVLRDGRHALLVADGASAFAMEAGVERSDPAELLAHARASTAPRGGDTVGAVARDAGGHVAVVVSTGGVGGKLPGRVGDSPLVGCGFYADDALGGVCATGRGEDFMRLVLSFRTASRLAAVGAQEAVREAIETLGSRVEGSGGLIAIDARGAIGSARNTTMMPCARRSS